VWEGRVFRVIHFPYHDNDNYYITSHHAPSGINNSLLIYLSPSLKGKVKVLSGTNFFIKQPSLKQVTDSTLKAR
jgi:hypothetical protein